MKRLAAVLALMLFLVLGGTGLAQAGPSTDSPWDDRVVRTHLAPDLLKQLLAAAPGERVAMIVVMREQAGPLNERAELVPALQATAARSQAGVRAFLAGEQSAGRAEGVRPFWIFNGLALRAVPETARALARRDDVALVRLDHYQKRLAPGEEAGASPQKDSLAWGVQQVRADRVWTAFNDTGVGIVVANMDTGVDFQHPALNANYRGNVGKGLYQHTGNWFDATGDGATYPVDGYGHGTHTMGTIAGQGGIGLAPGARWIAARVLNNQGMAYDSWLHAGFEWILAPAGDPKLAPQVLNNSWSSAISGSTEFQNDIARLRQAGIVVVFSAGNNGPDPESVGSPAALPGALAVGATDSDDDVAGFSSRGPSPWHQIKPVIAAPGVNIPSSYPGGGYAVESGTSMAAPHIAGIAALMLAVNPSLTVTATEYALTSTAVSHSAIVPNNDNGWGRADAYAAVQAAAGAGVVQGTLVDAGSRLPLPGAQVNIERYGSTARLTLQTDASGQYRAGLAAGAYRVTGAHFGYGSDSAAPVTVVTGTATTQDLALPPLPTGVLRGTLTDADISHPATATLSVLNTPVAQTAYGQYHLDLPAGSYTVQARGLGYRVVTATVTIAAGQVTQQNFTLSETPRILLVNSGAWYYSEYPEYFHQALDDLGYAYDDWRIKQPLVDTPVITDLLKYNLVIWSSPQDSPGLIGAGSTLTRYLKSGRRLMLTGQDVAFWDGGGSGLFSTAYLHDYLKTNFVSDDSGSREVAGSAGDIMAGLALPIAGGTGANNQTWPDEISLTDTEYGAGIFDYTGNGLAGSRVGLCLPYRGVFLAFGFEGISSDAGRQAVMSRAIDYLFRPPPTTGFSLDLTTPRVQVGPPGTVVTFTLRARNTGEGGSQVSYETDLQPGAWQAAITPARFNLAPCASTALTVTARVPATAPIDARNPMTLTITPVGQPAATSVVTLTAKAPAPVLLIDHHRWYDVQSAYTQALQQAGVAYDLWTLTTDSTSGGGNGPSANQMSWYPIVVWFTGYDWYRPVSTYDESQLGAYLDRGGRLMLSSAFYLDQLGQPGVSTFARNRLGVLDFTLGITATQTYGSPGQPLGAGFGRVSLVDPFPRAGFFTLDGVLVPTAAAETAWRGDHNRAQAIAHRGSGSRSVFWTVPFEALSADQRGSVMQRMLGWLGPLGQSTVRLDPPVIASGQPATATLVLRNDSVRTQAALTATLPPGTRPDGALPPELSYDPAANALRFAGNVAPGAALTFTVRLDTSGATPGRQRGQALFRDERLGINFDQPLELGVAAPDLAGSAVTVEPAVNGRPGTVTVVLRNNGPVVAESASAVALLPLDARVVTGTLQLNGPGTVQAADGSVTWQGALASGQTATITVQVNPPSLKRLGVLPVELLAWDGINGAWEWRTWLQVAPKILYYPWVAR